MHEGCVPVCWWLLLFSLGFTTSREPLGALPLCGFPSTSIWPLADWFNGGCGGGTRPNSRIYNLSDSEAPSFSLEGNKHSELDCPVRSPGDAAFCKAAEVLQGEDIENVFDPCTSLKIEVIVHRRDYLGID